MFFKINTQTCNNPELIEWASKQNSDVFSTIGSDIYESKYNVYGCSYDIYPTDIEKIDMKEHAKNLTAEEIVKLSWIVRAVLSINITHSSDVNAFDEYGFYVRCLEADLDLDSFATQLIASEVRTSLETNQRIKAKIIDQGNWCDIYKHVLIHNLEIVDKLCGHIGMGRYKVEQLMCKYVLENDNSIEADLWTPRFEINSDDDFDEF